MKKQLFKKSPPKKEQRAHKQEGKKKEQKRIIKFPSFSRLFTERISEARPRAARIIPELVTKSGVIIDGKTIIGFVSGCVLLLIVMQLVDVRENYLALKQVQFDRTHVLAETLYWQKIIQKYPSYRDAYFRLAVLANSIGEKEQARAYLLKTIELDPTFDKGKEMLQRLED